jgi:predicted metalloprotease with PDZ domain
MFKKILVAVFPLLCFSFVSPAASPVEGGEMADLCYEITLKGEHRIHVKLVYMPVDRDSTVFVYGEPLFGGQKDISKCLMGVKAEAPAKIKADWPQRRLTVYYKGKKPVTIEYDIADEGRKDKDAKSELYRPVIQKDYLYCHGINLFLRPLFRSARGEIVQSVRWLNKPPYPVFFSYDPANKGDKLYAGDVNDFMFCLLTGAKNLSVDNIKIGNTAVSVVLNAGSRPDENRKTVNEYIKRYYHSIMHFWNDEEPARFSFVLQPFLCSVQDIGGMAFDNGFVAKYSVSGGLILNDDRIFTISHEIGHRWIGGDGINAGINNLWFTEGFNDYVTYYVLLSSKLITPDKFLKEFNARTMQSHYGSSVKNIPNAKVFDNFWKLGDCNRLPYRRGCLFAFWLDNRIAMATGGKKDIRDFLLALDKLCKKKETGYVFTKADFVKTASEYVPADIIDQSYDRYIMAGDPILFTSKMLMPFYGISYRGSIPGLVIKDKKAFSKRFELNLR